MLFQATHFSAFQALFSSSSLNIDGSEKSRFVGD